MTLIQEPVGVWWLSDGIRRRKINKASYPTHFVFHEGTCSSGQFINVKLNIGRNTEIVAHFVIAIYDDAKKASEMAERHFFHVFSWRDLANSISREEFTDILHHLNLESF